MHKIFFSGFPVNNFFQSIPVNRDKKEIYFSWLVFMSILTRKMLVRLGELAVGDDFACQWCKARLC